MNDQTRSIALVIAGLAFVAFLLSKLLGGARADPRRKKGQQRIAVAVLRARDRALPVEERAAAFREAALGALEDLRRPSLAASYARRAERLAPHNVETLGLLVLALRRASRFRALERLLWRRLAETESGTEEHARALSELIDLAKGPLQRPEIAAALHRLTGSRK